MGRIAARGNAYARMLNGRLRRIAGLVGEGGGGVLSCHTAMYVYDGDKEESLVIASLPNICAVYFCEPFWSAFRMRSELKAILRHYGVLLLITEGNNVETFTESGFEHHAERLGVKMFSRTDMFVIGILPMYWGSNCASD